MFLQWTIQSFLIFTVNSEILKFITRSHTSHLHKYVNYLDTTLLHFQIPSDTSFASFKIEVEEKQQNIFPCKSENISLYFKQGGPPVINPDGSKFPYGFFNLSRPTLHFLNFTSKSPAQYLNITSPVPGIYFVSSFIAYTDPRYDGINQQGLVPKCHVYLDVTLYLTVVENVEIVINDVDTAVNIAQNEYKVFKFYSPDSVNHALIEIKSNISCEDCDHLNIRIQPHNVPSPLVSIKSLDIPVENFTGSNYYLNIWTPENVWYYVRFEFIANPDIDIVTSESGNLTFKIKFFSLPPPEVEENTHLPNDSFTNETETAVNQAYVPDPLKKLYRDQYISNTIHYYEYDLVRERNSDSFMFTYDLRAKKNGKIPLYINISSGYFHVLKFDIQDETDGGGTAQFHLAIRPRVKNVKSKIIVEPEPKNNTVLACVRRGVRELPLWPHNCFADSSSKSSPIFLNNSVENGSVLIPYPESGTWYASIRLFCGPCRPCNCSDYCQEIYKECSEVCEQNCKQKECINCPDLCKVSTISKDVCKGCDCEGGCIKENITCNTSLIFEVSSFSCIDGACGDNGKCVFSIAEGFVLTSCVCSNNYRGWDCSDNSLANSYSIIVLEMILLTMSNLMFIPAVYIAFKRQYYVESLVYLALCLSSIFYHACDAGNNIISYCLTKLYVLQFSDFFCALLSLWVTLIAIAHLQEPFPPIFHMLGAIVLAFGTTVNKMSIWLFALPSLSGVVIISISWFVKYRELKRIFPSKHYLRTYFSTGVVVVTVGLITYAFLQTRNNYKYLHSLWHVLMAIGIIILLPNKNTFLPSNL